MPAKRSTVARPMNIVTLQSSDAEAKYRIVAGASMNSHRAACARVCVPHRITTWSSMGAAR